MIRLPEKCEEDWNTMEPMEKGRLCAACDKCVVDFTPMTDTEIFRYFKERRNDSICGQFSPDQLNRTIRPGMERKSIFLKYKLAASVLLGSLALIPKSVNAQKQEAFQIEEPLSASGSRQVQIRGVVKDQEGKPMGGAKIKFDCVDTVMTDSAGRYSYEYIGIKTSLSLAVWDSTGEVYHEQLSISHLAIGHCSHMVKDVSVVTAKTVIPQCHYDEQIIRHGGIVAFDIVAPRWMDNARDTFKNFVDTLINVTPKKLELNEPKDDKMSDGTLKRLKSRLVPQYREPELEIRGYRKPRVTHEVPNTGNIPGKEK